MSRRGKFILGTLAVFLALRHISAKTRHDRLASWRRRQPLLIHGDADVDTRPDHSQRIYAALKGDKRLMLVPGATHNQSLRPEVWREIERWIDKVVPG